MDDLERLLDVVRAIEEVVGATSKKVRLGGNEEETNMSWSSSGIQSIRRGRRSSSMSSTNNSVLL